MSKECPQCGNKGMSALTGEGIELYCIKCDLNWKPKSGNYGFRKEQDSNRRNNKRLADKRLDDNERVLRSYRIKRKKDEK